MIPVMSELFEHLEEHLFPHLGDYITDLIIIAKSKTLPKDLKITDNNGIIHTFPIIKIKEIKDSQIYHVNMKSFEWSLASATYTSWDFFKGCKVYGSWKSVYF